MMFLAGLMMAIAVEHSGLHYRYQRFWLLHTDPEFVLKPDPDTYPGS
jgi:hypothetical protein